MQASLNLPGPLDGVIKWTHFPRYWSFVRGGALMIFFGVRLDKRLSKQWWGWWFETLSRPLWRLCNEMATRTWHNLLERKHMNRNSSYLEFAVRQIWNQIKYCTWCKDQSLRGAHCYCIITVRKYLWVFYVQVYRLEFITKLQLIINDYYLASYFSK